MIAMVTMVVMVFAFHIVQASKKNCVKSNSFQRVDTELFITLSENQNVVVILKPEMWSLKMCRILIF